MDYVPKESRAKWASLVRVASSGHVPVLVGTHAAASGTAPTDRIIVWLLTQALPPAHSWYLALIGIMRHGPLYQIV